MPAGPDLRGVYRKLGGAGASAGALAPCGAARGATRRPQEHVQRPTVVPGSARGCQGTAPERPEFWTEGTPTPFSAELFDKCTADEVALCWEGPSRLAGSTAGISLRHSFSASP